MAASSVDFDVDGWRGLCSVERDVSMLYETDCQFTADDVEDWMWNKAGSRAGYWTITIPLRTGNTDFLSACVPGIATNEKVVYKRVNFTQKEYSLLDKVITNQIYAESKAKVYRGVVYQRSLQLWESGNEDDVTMRIVGPWAVAYYKCQKNKFRQQPCSWYRAFFGTTFVAAALGCNEFVRKDYKAGFTVFGVTGLVGACYYKFLANSKGMKFRTTLTKTADKIVVVDAALEGVAVEVVDVTPEVSGEEVATPADDSVGTDRSLSGSRPDAKSPKNKLGYQKAGSEYINEHEGGGVDGDDSEIRANINGRLIKRDCGVGVVGQTIDDTGKKQICGVLSQPISVEPNVYAQELQNAIKAIEERINKKQRPFAGSEEDKRKIGRMISQSIHGKKNSPFSTKKVLDCIHTLIYEEIKSNKWTEARVTEAIEKLCREIDPTFKLKAAVKLEAMPEEKAPRLLIADEDVGQVMALMTIYCIETLIKKHFPEKGIKGLSKKDAIKRVMKACKVPRKVARKLVTIFEGDGSAWDTTCSAMIREWVENPVINHVANLVNGFLEASPDSWAKAHASICSEEKLDISYSKNKEYQKITIDAIRRSGHRGTSTLNWWMNFVLWHCAIFEDPEEFLDPAHRYGKDVAGENNRWMNSAFEGDDSFLVTAPRIQPGKQLHTMILQFWERVGFNMKIEIRDKKALFVGYYIGLDECGPVFDEKLDEWMMIPEIDRCFSRAGTSCSSAMIQAFAANQTDKCIALAGAAAMSRAYEFAGCCPTISDKFLHYAIDCDFVLTYDLQMRTNTAFEDKSELVDHIRAMNATCAIEEKILTSTGFWISDDEKAKFQDFTWHYSQLEDWQGFKDSLPVSWRA